MEQRLQDKIYMYSKYLKRRFGRKVFRVGLSLGYECPHRKDNSGCIFCRRETFTGNYQTQNLSVTEQLNRAVPRIKKTCGNVALLAYFQDETSTAVPLEVLKKKFDEAIKYNDVKGIVISTRPDYVNREIAGFLRDYPVPVTVELGMQTIHDESLSFLNRAHSFEDTERAVDLCGKSGLQVGLHLIMGIPNETMEDMKDTVRFISRNKFVNQVKFHNLVAYKGTELGRLVRKGEVELLKIDDYIQILCEVIPYLRGDIVITRLFTSNVKKTQIAENIEGNKTKWMNKLRMLLYKKGIIQGSETDVIYSLKQL